MARTIRDAILQELKRRNWTVYRLAKELDGQVHMRVVYQFLKEGQDTGTENASKMLEILGLTISPSTHTKRAKKPRKEKSNG